MPVKFPCSNCKKACKECKEEGQESICCDRCLNWVHFRCTNESRETLVTLILFLHVIGATEPAQYVTNCVEKTKKLFPVTAVNFSIMRNVFS